MSNKSVYFVTCQDNPSTVFGVAESSAEATKIIDTCVDAAEDSLSQARYDYVIKNKLNGTETLDANEYAEHSLIQQVVAANYFILEMPLNTYTETNLNSVIPPLLDEEDED